MEETRCFLLCDNRASEGLTECEDCKLIHYCSPECLYIHKGGRSDNFISNTGGENVCLPFRVSFRKGVGKILEAVRDIKCQELVLVDSAYLLSPQSLPICPVCLKSLPVEDEALDPCPSCSLPTCSPKCSSQHVGYPECGAYAGFEKKWRRNDPNILFSAIGVIRYLKTKDLKTPLPTKWMNELMDHLENIKKDEVISQYLNSLVEFLTNDCSLGSYSLSEIERAYGVLRINCVGMEYNHQGRGLFPLVAGLSHSCISNLKFEELTDSDVVLLAQRNIQKNDELSIRYISFMTGTNGRQTLLADQWYFNCHCARCLDPTELGTKTSYILCESQCGGLIGLKGEKWFCDTCSKAFEENHIRDALSKAVALLSDESVNLKDTDICESVLTRAKEELLSPAHFLIMKMTVHIISLYITQKPVREYERSKLENLKKHSENILRYLDKLDPGASVVSGTFLQQYAQVKTALLYLDMKEKTKNQIQSIQEIKSIASIEKKSQKILKKIFVKENENVCYE